MDAVIKENKNIIYNPMPATVYEEVIQNLTFLLNTPKYSIPLDRGFGLGLDYTDKPQALAIQGMTAELYEVIQDYEPRATVKNITFEEVTETGTMKPRIEVSINE